MEGYAGFSGDPTQKISASHLKTEPSSDD